MNNFRGNSVFAQILFVWSALCWISSVCAMEYGVNLLVPYNPLIRPLASSEELVQFFIMAEAGIGHAAAFDAKHKTDALRIYNCQQNALAMLEGFPDGSPQAALFTNIDPFHSANDGKRGLFDVSGKLKLDAGGGCTLRYFFGHGWSINAYLPFYSMRLDCVQWLNQTADITAEDERVRLFLTDNFAANVGLLGDGLDIGSWHRAGVGDLAILLDWHRDFPQDKPVLRNVAINTRAGFSIPTGLRADLDHIAAIPFGADGAWTLPFALDLELTFGTCVQLGLDVQLIHIFGHTHTERVPTAYNQTTLLYLQKACVFRDFGWNQQFSLYGGITNLPEGFSASIGYQYIKQGASKISPISNGLSTTIIQSSPALLDWTIHQVIARADYDCSQWLPDSIVSPRFSLFVQFPFNGKRSTLFTTIGGSIALDF
jgi:hypothetical protein